MEFEELKQAWDSQNKKPYYIIDEKALHNRIQTKKNAAIHITNISELLSIFTNIGVAAFILIVEFTGEKHNLFMSILGIWMLIVSVYILNRRFSRIRAELKFDRTLLGELTHALSTATYQVRLSNLLRWNTVPVCILIGLSFWASGKSIWIIAGMVVFLGVTLLAADWEHAIYRKRKRELEILIEKVQEEK